MLSKFDMHALDPPTGPFDHEVQRICLAQLGALLHQVEGAHSAGLVSSDGLEIAAIVRDGVSMSRMAAIASTLSAVGSAFLQEMGHRKGNTMLIESEDGKALLLGIEAGSMQFSLFAGASEDTVLGKLLFSARECERALIPVLSRLADR